MKTLLSELTPLIGFRESDSDLGIGELSDELKKSTSGLTVDQCHELLHLSTLNAARRSNWATFADFLTETKLDAIRALITLLQTRLAEAGLSPQMLANSTLYPHTVNPPIINHAAGINGLRITPLKRDVAIRIERFRLDTPLTAPVVLTLTDETTGETQTITAAAVGVFQSIPVESPVILRHGHTYTLTYATGPSSYNTAPAAQPKKPCRGCSNCLTSFVKVEPTALTHNFGINLVMSARGDVTGRLIDDPNRLISCLKHQIAMTFLEKIAFSDRKNGQTEDAIQGALFELKGKDNADRVPIRLEKAVATVVAALMKESNSELDIDDSDDITWEST